jgi:AP-3 complex subunit mu
LSGVPDLTLTFVDPELIDDCSFHPCVRYNRFERDRVVSFVPPDGIFELMRYRVHRQAHAIAPCYCQPSISFEYNANQGSILVNVGQKSNSSVICTNKRSPSPLVEDVVVIIPFSKNVRTANLQVSSGTVLFDESSKVAKWTIGKLVKDKIPQLSGTIVLQPNSKFEEAPPIELNWKVITATVSGLAVSSLTLTNERYRPYKGVRSIARSGKYQIRSI